MTISRSKPAEKKLATIPTHLQAAWKEQEDRLRAAESSNEYLRRQIEMANKGFVEIAQIFKAFGMVRLAKRFKAASKGNFGVLDYRDFPF